MNFFCLTALSLMILTTTYTEACSGIFLKSKNGDPVFGRTMEFAESVLSFNLIAVPKNYEYKTQTSLGKPGIVWKTKYTHAGFAPFGLPLIADGMNEKGLSFGAFYFPGYAGYQEIAGNDLGKTLNNLNLGSWILSNFETVDEAINALKEVKVTGLELKEWGFVPPLHYHIADANGSTAIIEYIDGKLNIHENNSGSFTNSPEYSWHLKNLRNYVGLQALNRPEVKIDDRNLAPFSQGTGGIGLPGDFTSPSRFVRGAFFAATTIKGTDGPDSIKRLFTILDQFNIPPGSVREMQNGHVILEVTQWTSASDLKNGIYYFKTENNPNVRKIVLKDLNLEGTKIVTQSILEPEAFADVSKNFKPDL